MIMVKEHVLREDVRVKAWTPAVKMRDGFECKKCHVKKNLQSHHCIPYNIAPEMAFDINNGITLCRSCHSDFHSRFGSTSCGHYEISVVLGAAAGISDIVEPLTDPEGLITGANVKTPIPRMERSAIEMLPRYYRVSAEVAAKHGYLVIINDQKRY